MDRLNDWIKINEFPVSPVMLGRHCGRIAHGRIAARYRGQNFSRPCGWPSGIIDMQLDDESALLHRGDARSGRIVKRNRQYIEDKL